jgi:hypothetical protein
VGCVFGTLGEAFALNAGLRRGTFPTLGGYVFRFAPSFLCGAFDLLGGAGVGEILIAEGFADFLLDGACSLIEFSFYGFFVHDATPGWLRGRQ